jgi:hypothetical protein
MWESWRAVVIFCLPRENTNYLFHFILLVVSPHKIVDQY